MMRFGLFLLVLATVPLLAEDEFRPVISIDSPDVASTFVFASIKNRSLIWSEKTHTLFAEVTFIDEQQSTNQPNDDTHRFQLPGVLLDRAQGVFYATSKTGERVPIAKQQKDLFFTTIKVLPNAIVRIFHPHGAVSVRLEAIRPSELAKIHEEQNPSSANGDGSHTINLEDIIH